MYQTHEEHVLLLFLGVGVLEAVNVINSKMGEVRDVLVYRHCIKQGILVGKRDFKNWREADRNVGLKETRVIDRVFEKVVDEDTAVCEVGVRNTKDVPISEQREAEIEG